MKLLIWGSAFLLILANVPFSFQIDCPNFPTRIFLWPPYYDVTDFNCLNHILGWFFKYVGLNFFDGTNDVGGNMGPVNTTVQSQIQQNTSLNHFYMYFAGAAYCFRSTLTNLTCPWCGNLTTPATNYTVAQVIYGDPVSDQLVYIAVSTTQKQIVVTYRGTLNIPSIIYDLEFCKVGATNVKVHSGFQRAFDSTYPQVVSNVSALLTQNPGFKLVVTGHSLGGAEAALLVYYATSQNIFQSVAPNLVLELYTYGEPRVGNQAWADYINNLNMTIVRTVNDADIVPHLVPAGLGYFHHQTEYWINDGTSNTPRYCNRSVYEDPTCSDSKGPLYDPLDHVQYFDVPVLACAALQPFDFLAQFVVNLPILVEEINNTPFTLSEFVLGIVNEVVTLLSVLSN